MRVKGNVSGLDLALKSHEEPLWLILISVSSRYQRVDCSRFFLGIPRRCLPGGYLASPFASMSTDHGQLPGSMASERATGLTSHLDAMGCRKSARVMWVPTILSNPQAAHMHTDQVSSWHLSVSSAYFIAWIVVAVIWQRAIFSETNVGLFIVLYVVTGLSLASWTHLVCVPFASAPTLAAITCKSAFAVLIPGLCLTRV